MLDITDFIKPELLILVPVLYIVGLGLKKTSLSDKFIPLITTCEVFDQRCILTIIFASITQGILCAGASVYANQIYKQLFDKKGEK